MMVDASAPIYAGWAVRELGPISFLEWDRLMRDIGDGHYAIRRSHSCGATQESSGEILLSPKGLGIFDKWARETRH